MLEKIKRRLRIWYFSLRYPGWGKAVRAAFTAKPPPPPEWGEGWTSGIPFPKGADEKERYKRYSYALSAGLLSYRRDDQDRLYYFAVPGWYDEAGEALALLRGERLPKGGKPDETN